MRVENKRIEWKEKKSQNNICTFKYQSTLWLEDEALTSLGHRLGFHGPAKSCNKNSYLGPQSFPILIFLSKDTQINQIWNCFTNQNSKKIKINENKRGNSCLKNKLSIRKGREREKIWNQNNAGITVSERAGHQPQWRSIAWRSRKKWTKECLLKIFKNNNILKLYRLNNHNRYSISLLMNSGFIKIK